LDWLRREGLLLAIFGGFGLLVLPALVYLVGQVLLGEYRPGAGMGAFYADFYGHLAGASPWAWLLVFGPYLAIQLLRLLWLPLGLMVHRPRRRERESRNEERIEPTI
jgi:hypothetical protein